MQSTVNRKTYKARVRGGNGIKGPYAVCESKFKKCRSKVKEVKRYEFWCPDCGNALTWQCNSRIIKGDPDFCSD